jgi:hypothetical protein
VPAPGRGVVSIAREAAESQPSPMLNIAYRSRQMAFRRKQISQWIANEHEILHEEVTLRQNKGEKIEPGYVASREADIEQEAVRQEKAAQATYGMLQGNDSRVAPLRRALAVWGLNADDLGSSHASNSVDCADCNLSSRGYFDSRHKHYGKCKMMSSFVSFVVSSSVAGSERNAHISRYLLIYLSNSRKCHPCYGTEELDRSFKGWLSRVADDRSMSNCDLWHRPRKPQRR